MKPKFTIERMLKVSRAYYNDDKVIQCREIIGTNGKWEDIDGEPEWDWISYDYRVKPEKRAKAKYRPFENAEEICQAMNLHQSTTVMDKRSKVIYELYYNKFSGKFGKLLIGKTSYINVFGTWVEFEENVPNKYREISAYELFKHFCFYGDKAKCGVKIK